MPASAVSSPTASMRTRMAESVATVPATTRSPGPLATGRDSPVIMDSSTSASPSTIAPSAGTREPERTRTRSPTVSSATGTGVARPSAPMRSASSGSMAARAASAPCACPMAFISCQWPSSMIETSAPSSHQKSRSNSPKAVASEARCDRLSRPRRTTAAPPRPRSSAVDAPGPSPVLGGPGGRDLRRFPCSLWFARWRRSPTVSLRPRCGCAVALSHSLPTSFDKPVKEFTTAWRWLRAASDPDLPGSSRCPIERRTTSVPHVLLSISLAGTAPSGSTGHVPALSGLLPPFPASPGSGCPQLH